MIWRLAINEKDGMFDALGESVHRDILDLGLDQVRAVAVTQVYRIEGEVSAADDKHWDFGIRESLKTAGSWMCHAQRQY